MKKNILESYRANKRLIAMNLKKIEKEELREIPAVSGKVMGSSSEFPYTERRFTVLMDDPEEAERSRRRIKKWKIEIDYAEKMIAEAEKFVDSISNIEDRDIISMYYLEGERKVSQKDIAEVFCCERSSISKKISKYL